MAIFKPANLTFKNKKIRMLIAGYPGIGKTTLALSAPHPLYIDVDLSAERIEPEVLAMAEGVTQPRDYDELRKDLGMGLSPMELQQVKNDLAAYETIVVDTGGKLLTIMGNYGRKIDNKYARRDGSLSLQGYGWLGKEFQRFLDHCIYELDKHIVIVFHTVEEKDGDDTKLRIKAEGQSKNSVWEVMDLGGFMEIRNGVRTIGFDNCERFFAKGTRGVHGVRPIPELIPGRPNDFLSKLFLEYNAKTAADAEKTAAEKAVYDAVMSEGTAIINGIVDPTTANAAMAKFQALQHALTSKAELGKMFNVRIRDIGLCFDQQTKTYQVKAPTQAPAPEQNGGEA